MRMPNRAKIQGLVVWSRRRGSNRDRVLITRKLLILLDGRNAKIAKNAMVGDA